tara:strand:- start:1625 stop:1822 length:198 start_codon:yes stop_codon:yes gene_type:complete
MVLDTDLFDISNSILGMLKRIGVKKNKVAIREVSIGETNSKKENNLLNQLGAVIAGLSSFLLSML